MMTYILLFVIILTFSSPVVVGSYMDESTSLSMLYLAYSSYCGGLINQTFNCYWCLNIQDSFQWVGNFGDSSKAPFGFVGFSRQNKTVLVSFRGTDDFDGVDWDNDDTLVPYGNIDGALVHEGFYHIYNNVSRDVHFLIETAFLHCGSECTSIFVTGHSMGAAVALLAAVDLHNYSVPIVLINFGSPRVGNKVFALYAHSLLGDITRHTNGRDPVPHFPQLEYYHIPTEIWRYNDVYYVCDESGEDPNCSDSLLDINLVDHALYMGVDILTGIPHGCLYTDP